MTQQGLYQRKVRDPGWRALACAILEQSWMDAHSKNQERRTCETGLPRGIRIADDARQFLAGNGARVLLGLLELDEEILDDINDRLPRPEYAQLTFLLE